MTPRFSPLFAALFSRPCAPLVLGLLLALGAPAQAQRLGMDTPAAPALDKTEQKIVADMARANIAEIEAARVALVRAHSPQVKAYAQQMIDDHGKALADVRELAQEKGVEVPAQADARHKGLLKALSRLEGARFDKAYMSQAGVADHTRVHKALTQHHQRARDPDLKALVAKMLPTVEQHLHHATELRDGAAKGAQK